MAVEKHCDVSQLHAATIFLRRYYMYEKKPWLKYYGDVPHSLNYPKVTMYEALMSTVQHKPNAIAWDFMGYTATYKEFTAY